MLLTNAPTGQEAEGGWAHGKEGARRDMGRGATYVLVCRYLRWLRE